MNAVDDHKTDLALDDSNDIDLNASTGSLNTVTGKRELSQKISNLLNINRGEISWNRNLGMNQYEILMNNGNSALIQSQVSNYLKQVFGKAFNSCDLDNERINKNTRTKYITLDVTLNSNNGPITINPSLLIGGEQ